MPRIPDEVLERLKREVSLERLVTMSGVRSMRLTPPVSSPTTWDKRFKIRITSY